MIKEDFIKLGIDEATALKCETASQEAVEDYNGTLEQCRKEIDDTTLAYKNVCDMYGESHEAARRGSA